MAYRLIYSEFWTDPYVQEELTPEDKYFYLYILTNPHTTMCGIYTITKKQIAFELGYSIESVNSLMERFENNHKLIKYNKETRELAIKNWGKHNLNKGGKPVIDCLTKELNNVKDRSLIKYIGIYVKSETLKKLYDSYNDTSDDSCNDSGAIQNTDTEYRIQNTNTSSSENEEMEEKESELKEVLRLCQNFDYKLKKIDAKCLIDAFGGLVVKKAIGVAANTAAFRNNQIKNYSSYLASILKDLSTEETKTINISHQKGKLKFSDYEQREYDNQELENELLGWDD